MSRLCGPVTGLEDVRGVAGYISRSDDVRETAGGFPEGNHFPQPRLLPALLFLRGL